MKGTDKPASCPARNSGQAQTAEARSTPEDAIATDDPSDPNALPYVNIFAARAEDADNETYQKLVEIYQNSQDVLDGVQEASGGTAQFVTTPAADLVASLEDVQEDIAANQ